MKRCLRIWCVGFEGRPTREHCIKKGGDGGIHSGPDLCNKDQNPQVGFKMFLILNLAEASRGHIAYLSFQAALIIWAFDSGS